MLYLYYRFDNRPYWYRALWSISNLGRIAIARLPSRLRYWTCQLIAAIVYWPFARTAALAERWGADVRGYPLSWYRHAPFYQMRNDSYDRFGTKLERRFTRSEIEAMMRSCGLVNIEFSNTQPFWCAVGYKQ